MTRSDATELDAGQAPVAWGILPQPPMQDLIKQKALAQTLPLKEGDAGTEILRTAKEISSDIIVMGSHGRTGLSRLLMGSVAEAVSRKAHCPVLTVKHPFPETSSGEPAAPPES